jgi:hypothetical protein
MTELANPLSVTIQGQNARNHPLNVTLTGFRSY